MDGSAVSTLAFGALWVLVIVHSFVLLGVVHVAHGLSRQPVRRPGVGGLSIGDEAPRFQARSLDGRKVASEQLSGRDFGLLFISPTCESCRLTVSELRAAVVRAAGELFVVCEGNEAECRDLVADYGVPVPTLPDPLGTIRARYGIRSVPTAVIVDPEGRIASVGRPDRTGLGVAERPASNERARRTERGESM